MLIEGSSVLPVRPPRTPVYSSSWISPRHPARTPACSSRWRSSCDQFASASPAGRPAMITFLHWQSSRSGDSVSLLFRSVRPSANLAGVPRTADTDGTDDDTGILIEPAAFQLARCRDSMQLLENRRTTESNNEESRRRHRDFQSQDQGPKENLWEPRQPA